jgi:hypothetical protein
MISYLKAALLATVSQAVSTEHALNVQCMEEFVSGTIGGMTQTNYADI